MERLGAWLGGRTADQLAEVLAARPDVMYPPPPATLGELADRLSRSAGMWEAAYQLDQPALQVIEACQALGDGATREALAGLLAVPVGDRALARALERLADLALVWPDDSGRLRLAWPLRQPGQAPLLLGEPADQLLAELPADALRRIVANLGAGPARLKRDLVAAAAAVLGDCAAVRASLSAAPRRTQELITELAWHGPVLSASDDGYRAVRYPPEVQWALDRGMLVEVMPATMMLPREVALAVRGPDHRAPFDPQPPTVEVVAGDLAAVATEAAGAAGRAIGQVTALLDHIADRPAALLRSGGIGVRELRRLAPVIGADVAAVRLWLEVTAAAGLLAPDDGAVRVTEAYDDWRAAEPADQLPPLVSAWWELAVAPTWLAGQDGAKPAVAGMAGGAAVPPVRRALLAGAAELAPDRIADLATLVAGVQWRWPGRYADLADATDDAAGVLLATWGEAAMLALVAHDQVSALGHAVLAGDVDAMAGAARGMLPAAEETAVFQADLTAVVRGTPSGRLAALLDLVADRESRDSASTWRFSVASIRRALDAGETSDELLDALATVSTTPLPQPLTYLVADVARRHGAVRVTPVACCVCSDDPSLLAEIAAARGLRKLGLRMLAPTVLASAEPVGETLRLLRDRGYAPVCETSDGVPKLERAARRRASGSGRSLPPTTGTTPLATLDPREVAHRLVGTPATVPDLPVGTDDTAGIVRAAAHLPVGEARLLAHAIDHDHPVRIDYRNADGRPSSRVISELALDVPYLTGYCHLRGDDRVFLLSRIEAVALA